MISPSVPVNVYRRACVRCNGNERRVSATALAKDRSIQQHLPWQADKAAGKAGKKNLVVVVENGSSEDQGEGVAATKRELRSMRRAKGSATQPVLSSVQKHLEDEKMAFYDAERTLPNYGGFGKREMHWYALWVLTMKEEEMGQDLEATISRLGQVENTEGKLVARQADSWVPKKMRQKWSNRYKRMMEMPVKYGDGNWLFLQCIMDKEVYNLLQEAPAFRGYRPESCIEMRDKFEALLEFPKPLTEEFLQSVHAWEEAPGEADEVSLTLARMHAESEPEVEMERSDEPELDTFRTGQDDFEFNDWGLPSANEQNSGSYPMPESNFGSFKEGGSSPAPSHASGAGEPSAAVQKDATSDSEDEDQEEEEVSSFSLFTDSFKNGKYANRSFDPKFTLGGDDQNRRGDRNNRNHPRGKRSYDSGGYDNNRTFGGSDRFGDRRYEDRETRGDFPRSDRRRPKDQGFGDYEVRNSKSDSFHDDTFDSYEDESEWGNRRQRNRNDRGGQRDNRWDDRQATETSGDKGDQGWHDSRTEAGSQDEDIWSVGHFQQDDDYDQRGGRGGRGHRGGADDFRERSSNSGPQRMHSGGRGHRGAAGNAWDDEFSLDEVRGEGFKTRKRDSLMGPAANPPHGDSASADFTSFDSFDEFDEFGGSSQAMFDDIWNDGDDQKWDDRVVGAGTSRRSGTAAAAVPQDDLDSFNEFQSDFGSDEVTSEWEQWQQENDSISGAPKTSSKNKKSDVVRGVAAGDDFGSLWGDEPQGASSGGVKGGSWAPATRGSAKQGNAWDEFDHLDSFDDGFSDTPLVDTTLHARTSRSDNHTKEGFGHHSNDFGTGFSNSGTQREDGEPVQKNKANTRGWQKNTKSDSFDSFADDDWFSGGFDDSALNESASDLIQFTGWGENGSPGKPLTHPRGEGLDSQRRREESERQEIGRHATRIPSDAVAYEDDLWTAGAHDDAFSADKPYTDLLNTTTSNEVHSANWGLDDSQDESRDDTWDVTDRSHAGGSWGRKASALGGDNTTEHSDMKEPSEKAQQRRRHSGGRATVPTEAGEALDLRSEGDGTHGEESSSHWGSSTTEEISETSAQNVSVADVQEPVQKETGEAAAGGKKPMRKRS